MVVRGVGKGMGGENHHALKFLLLLKQKFDIQNEDRIWTPIYYRLKIHRDADSPDRPKYQESCLVMKIIIKLYLPVHFIRNYNYYK